MAVVDRIVAFRSGLGFSSRDGPLTSDIIRSIVIACGWPYEWIDPGIAGDRCVMLWRWYKDSREKDNGLIPELVSLIADFLGPDPNPK